MYPERREIPKEGWVSHSWKLESKETWAPAPPAPAIAELVYSVGRSSSTDLRTNLKAACWLLGLSTGPTKQPKIFLSFGGEHRACGSIYSLIGHE